MARIQTLLERLFTTDETVYECRNCGQTVESKCEPCPNCGTDEIGEYRVN